LPECGAIKVQEFAHTTLGGFDFSVDAIGREIDKKSRNFGQQLLESQLFFQF
jgi:hypothetical protein